MSISPYCIFNTGEFHKESTGSLAFPQSHDFNMVKNLGQVKMYKHPPNQSCRTRLFALMELETQVRVSISVFMYTLNLGNFPCALVHFKLTLTSCSSVRISSPSTCPVWATRRERRSAFLSRYCRIRHVLFA